ncbi:MAG: DNA mismatch repair endonuclease MutL, partial [Candidatus Marinimicrobia bacterium]|nr:DNA mismatch repair endonuclease MutL [Candidatus Neomarinimicrobiota bacterium]
MSKIKILNEQLTNKIAAGEVVQNPASLIKELVENSLDAGATEIFVVIKNGGKTLCEVTDNGEGMSKDDLLLAFERYATSKIATMDDLIRIRTLGFRGEALASIAAVSVVNAVTTLAGTTEGNELVIEGGNFREIKPHSPKPGTTISIRNLFYNIPARRKFLKSAEVEFRNIVEVIRKFSMIHNRVRFILVHNDREIFNLREESQKDRIVHLFSPEYRENLIPVSVKSGSYQVNGFVGNLNLVRARRGDQFFFVNNRFVTDRLMNHAVTEAYAALVSRGEFPFYCLHLELPPEMVDVNVHPTKMEVKFREQNDVYRFLQESVGAALKEITKVIPDLSKFSPFDFYAPTPVPKGTPVVNSTPDFILTEPPKSSSDRSEINPPNRPSPSYYFRPEEQEKWSERARRFTEQPSKIDEEISPFEVQVYQVHNKYIISQVKSGLV